MFGVFYMYEITSFLLFNNVQECSRCDSEFISYGLVCSMFSHPYYDNHDGDTASGKTTMLIASMVESMFSIT